MHKEYNQSPRQVLEDLHAAETGLSGREAETRLGQYGPNRLREAPKATLFQRFIQQLKDPMLLILMAAAAVSAVTNYLSHEPFTEVLIILAVVLLNAVLGVVQESKAEAAIEALQSMTAATSKVLRDGSVTELESSRLVPGDIVLLEAGDAVPADGRLLACASLQIEEAALTGESVPSAKSPEALTGEVTLGDRRNMAYMGSTVAYGRGRMVVTATGMDTEMGKIAGVLARTEQEETPLQKKLTQLGKTLSWLVLGICVFIFVFDLMVAGDFSLSGILETFMVAVSLAVAAIPEGLATVVTVVLSIGVTRMSRRNAVIRRLTAVETLGCTQVICSDKTGTLTQNKMTVVDHTGDTALLASAMALCSDAVQNPDGTVRGEPTEAALVSFAAQCGLPKPRLEQDSPRIAEAPFDSGRKMMSTLHSTPDGVVQYTKGAPDQVLARCTHYWEGGQALPMTDDRRREILADNHRMAAQALRVLAAASRPWPDGAPQDQSPAHLEQELCFIGLTGMIDPVRPQVKPAIEECRQAGIRPVMITGDHQDTAVAIARQLGILSDPSQAITGAALDALSDEELTQNVDPLQRLCPGPAGAQGPHRQRLAPPGSRHRHDRRRRQRRPLHQVRRYRHRHGHHRHRRHQKRGGHRPLRRQLRHHRGRRGRGPPDLRQHPQGHRLPAGQQHERGAGGVLLRPAGLHPPQPRPSAVHQPHHRLLPGPGPGHGAPGAGHHAPPAPLRQGRHLLRRPGLRHRLSGHPHHRHHHGLLHHRPLHGGGML